MQGSQGSSSTLAAVSLLAEAITPGAIAAALPAPRGVRCPMCRGSTSWLSSAVPVGDRWARAVQCNACDEEFVIYGENATGDMVPPASRASATPYRGGTPCDACEGEGTVANVRRTGRVKGRKTCPTCRGLRVRLPESAVG